MRRREFIQYSYEEKLKEELEDAPPKQLVLKDKITWYAEPGTAKASVSFDRKRYEMVCVLCCCSTPAYSPSSPFVMGPLWCRSSKTQQLTMSYFQLHEERRPGVGTNAVHQAFPNCRTRQDCIMELGVSKHRTEANRT